MLQLDQTLAEAHTSLAWAEFHGLEWTEAAPAPEETDDIEHDLVVTLARAFGRPILDRSRIRVEDLVDRWVAGDRSADPGDASEHRGAA